MQSLSGVGRVAAIGAVVAAVALVAIVLFGGFSGTYEVKADFINGGQLVKGNPVQSGGAPIGSVKDIKITSNGQAQVTLSIDSDHKPLRDGTRASIKQFSLSGIANRYVDLTYPDNSHKDAIPDGGTITIDHTSTAVDLDELFNTFDPKTRSALQEFFKGQAKQFAGQGDAANQALLYLNPALSTSSRLFSELTRDTPVLARFLSDSSRLVTAVAARRDDLAALIGNLDTTTRALASQKQALADSIGQLPPFMRQANTTFVNLRAALDDLDPLVNASKPVAKELGPFLQQARGFANDAVPTVADLNAAVRSRGPSNDLIDYFHSVPALKSTTLDTKDRSIAPGGHSVNVGSTRGAFPETVDALKGATPVIGFARPYTSDFLGWLDDFSTTGGFFDALGATGRGFISLAENFHGGPPKQGQYHRCPGGADIVAPDKSNLLTPDQQKAAGCTEADRAVR